LLDVEGRFVKILCSIYNIYINKSILKNIIIISK